jgi:DNA-binding NarL/FixJ family response regulator
MAVMTAPVRVVIVDDDSLVRSALSMMLAGADDIDVVGQAADGDEVPAAVETHRPDVVLMDIRMPRVDGITATERLRTRTNPPEVVVLTTFDADEHVLRALRVGASGFLLKDTPPQDIVDAIRRVAGGDPILSPSITRRLMDRVATEEPDRVRTARAALARLSDRERDVVAAIAEGKSNAQIAHDLYMSLATVKAHVSHVLTKLNLNNRTQIALLAHDAER